MKLRPYQEQSIQKIEEEWEKVDRTLLVLPTGCGKTIVFCKLTEKLVQEGKRVLILAHREELILQAQDKLKKSTGLDSAIEKANESALGSFFQVTIGSVQSLSNMKRLEQFDEDYYDVIIVDEAHHILSDSYRRIIDYFDAKLLGVTATPDRGDKKNLGQVFESIAYEYSLPEAIKNGYLSKIKAITIPLEIDISNVGSQAGDFKSSELDDALNPYLISIADEMETYCKDRKTIVFLPLIATSQKMTEILNSKGFRCAEINGNSKDRKEILSDFHNDKYNVLCNSMLLTEGFDEPSVDCIVCLRPTKVRALYSQIVGRGTRLFDGKEDLLVLDFLWHTSRHQLCRPAHLISENENVANKVQEIMERKGVQLDLDLIELEDMAKSEVVKDRENSLAEKLKAQKKRKRQFVDPVEYALSINSEDLADYEPVMVWEMSPPSQAQLAMLEKRGINPDEVQNAGYASKLIDRLIQRDSMSKSTPKQIRLLERYGFHHVGEWSKEQAKAMVTRISASGWRLPRGINPKEYKPAEIIEVNNYEF